MEISQQRLTLPLCQADCQQAIEQAAIWPDPASAQQVKYNALAALSARYYLKLIGIVSQGLDERSRQKTASSKSSFLNWGELFISPAQCLRCLPVVAGQPINDRALRARADDTCLGVLAIQVDWPRREVQILGFLPGDRLTFGPTPSHTQSLTQILQNLQPLTTLIAALSDLPIAYLQQWLTGTFESGWRQLSRPGSGRAHPSGLAPCFRSLPTSSTARLPEGASSEKTLLETIRHTQDDEQRWQAAEQLWEINPNHPESPILRAKDLGLYLAGRSVTLLVGVLAKADGQRLILTRLLPAEPKPYLPPNLTLTGADSAGDTVFSIQSRSQDDYIQFKFTAAAGDRFALHIGSHEASVTEHFIV